MTARILCMNGKDAAGEKVSANEPKPWRITARNWDWAMGRAGSGLA
jgi:hypothetical protein